MQNKARILSWAAVLLLLALPLALVVFGNAVKHPAERSVAARPVAPNPTTSKKGPAESTQRMAQRLRDVAEKLDVSNVLWGANDRRAAMFRKRLADAPDARSQLSVEYSLAESLLADGQNEDSLRQLDIMEAIARKSGVVFQPKDLQLIRMTRAQAQMRIGEKENCCAEHNGDSCLLPLRGGAIYQHQEGPRLAIRL